MMGKSDREEKFKMPAETPFLSEEEKQLQESFKEEDYRPKIVKIAATERLLPKNFIPDEQKDLEYEEKIGRTMPVVLFNFDSEEKIALPDLTAKVFKHAVRKTRERYEKPEDKQKRYGAIQRLVLSAVRKSFSPGEQARFDAKRWGVRAMTSVKEYERFAPVIFKEVEDDIKEAQKENADVFVSDAEREKIKQDAENLYGEWAKIMPAEKEIREILKVKPEAIKIKESIPIREEREKKIADLTEAQKARLMFGRIKAAGGREYIKEEVETQIEMQDRMPDYLAHRLAIYDIYFRVKSGEIENMPRLILSVASGPYGEARAQSDLLHLYEELAQEKPVIVNMDLTREMLKRGREEYEKKYAEKLLKTMSLTGRMEGPLIFKPEVFDMAECTSSLDYLQEPADIFKTISNMTEAVKIGGFVRLTSRRKFLNNFYEGLEGLGLKVLTERQCRLQLPGEIFETLKMLYGEEKAKNLKEMLSGGIYYILARRASREKIAGEIKIENFRLPSEKQEEEELIENKLLAIKLAHERLSAIEKAVKDGNICEAKNLFYEFGRQGREEAVKSGEISADAAEALSLAELSKKIGALIYKIWLADLSEKVFGKS